jgi:hypothetical protein
MRLNDRDVDLYFACFYQAERAGGRRYQHYDNVFETVLTK